MITLRDLLEVYPYVKAVDANCRTADTRLIHYITFSDKKPSGNGIFNDIREGKRTYIITPINHNGLKKSNGFTEHAWGYKEKSIPDEILDMPVMFLRVSRRWNDEAVDILIDLETNPLTVESVKDKIKRRAVKLDE